MAGNSARRGAVRRPGTKKGSVVGSGGQRRKGLQPKGPTPRAEDRPSHPSSRQQRAERQGSPAAARRDASRPDVIAGRNAVVEAFDAGLPAQRLMVLDNIEADDRVRAALARANKAGLPVTIATRLELDRAAGTPHHQGLALIAEPFGYIHTDDLPAASEARLAVALDHITDPHNLGAIARSAAAFAAAGLIVPQRRSSPVTAAAWKASAGALARIPVARVANLATTLADMQRQGWFVIGLDGSAQTGIDGISDVLAAAPLVLVVGSEGAGLSRLTAQRCDLLVRIPMPGPTESLNASVAAGVALYELNRRQARGPQQAPR